MIPKLWLAWLQDNIQSKWSAVLHEFITLVMPKGMHSRVSTAGADGSAITCGQTNILTWWKGNQSSSGISLQTADLSLMPLLYVMATCLWCSRKVRVHRQTQGYSKFYDTLLRYSSQDRGSEPTDSQTGIPRVMRVAWIKAYTPLSCLNHTLFYWIITRLILPASALISFHPHLACL